MAFLFGAACTIEISIGDADTRRYVDLPIENSTNLLTVPLYVGDETVKGSVKVSPVTKGKKMDHQGIQIELIGQIDMFYERGNSFEFLSMSKDLEAPGDLTAEKEYPFEFLNVEKQFESYNGINVRLRYFLKVTVKRGLVSNVVKEQDLWVRNFTNVPEVNHPIKMEVGIEDCLHIEFEYNRSKYHMKDVIIGKIYFLLVRIKIKHMELAIIKRESTGSGPNLYNESETVTKYEIMDGAPVRGESIPIRLFLSPFELTPTYKSISNKFSLKYYLNLVLVDEDDRRYFKQQEIILWRKNEKKRTKKGGRKAKTGEKEGTDAAVEQPAPSATKAPEAEKPVEKEEKPASIPAAAAPSQVEEKGLFDG
eukprot:TRINITY_DN5271_c0_g1_i1.p1 TRINITY_DN5271_c0_g1~~TRINITY_DN5271_c0_g1_i1.p1  ORF type:complete len:365 (+),score=97.63 TRINITY_DN5271_c0_g1_i1:64-1158(+)